MAKATASPFWESRRFAVTMFCAPREMERNRPRDKIKILEFIRVLRCTQNAKVYFTLSGFSAINFSQEEEEPLPLSGFVSE